jgi:TetR/AcrR family transcriptional regulator, mexCD-oprJ operon repressor
MPEATTDHRKAIAERNIEAILDATESLLLRGAPASTTAVAAEAGVSRVTVYAHFPTREALLEGVVERVVTRFGAALGAVDLRHGEPLEILDQVIAMGWSEQDRFGAVAGVVLDELSASALARAHRSLHDPVSKLIKRGQAAGSFREDLPADWLLSSYFALMHACGDDVRAGKIESGEAVSILQATIRGLFAARGDAGAPR